MNEHEQANERAQVDAETRPFDAEVHQLLKLMVNALYSNREIFLRELVSNASDALDKLRFEALTDEALRGLDDRPEIGIRVDAEGHRLVISDNGIGMTRQEVVDNLGTIARSGTARFLESLSGDQKSDAKLIGQFGVGFYSAFIVADRVTVETRHAAGADREGTRWSSDGEGEYTLENIERSGPGTDVVLDIAEQHRDLLDIESIKRIVRHYSNHISFPVRVFAADDEGEAPAVNDTQALWTRSKTEVEEDEYREFYQGLSGDVQPPAGWAHHHVEGTQSYTMLLFLPGQAPFDLAWNRDDRRGVKLYIQRVFIMDAAEQLVPRYLRFVRGVVDSADLPLNVSREILQDSPLLSRIRNGVIRRGLDMIERLADEGGESWTTFQREFGNVLKEGVIEDTDNRDRIAKLLRFASTEHPQPHSVALAEYLERAGEDADAIWYLTADSMDQAIASPHLEAFRSAGVEVLLLTDPIDVWLVNHLFEFDGKPLKSAASGEFEPVAADEAEDESAETADASVCGTVKKALGERVGNVRLTRRLKESASCLAEDAGGMTLQMRRMLRAAGQEVPEFKPDLEINPRHALVMRLEQTDDSTLQGELAHVLLDEALLVDGGELADPAGFVKRVNRLLSGGALTGSE
jgi:molecular chaperone HtpG